MLFKVFTLQCNYDMNPYLWINLNRHHIILTGSAADFFFQVLVFVKYNFFNIFHQSITQAITILS